MEQELIDAGYTTEGIEEIQKIASERGMSLGEAKAQFEAGNLMPVTKQDWEATAAEVRKVPGLENYNYVPEHLKNG